MSSSEPLRVVLFGTHPQQTNGYSKVVYEISRRICSSERHRDIKIFVFGFQRQPNMPQNYRDDIPSDLQIFDASANELPKQAGFGFSCIRDYIALCRPHVCVIYNDLLVITSILNEMREAKKSSTWTNFKVVPYLDQVYLCQRQPLLAAMNDFVDGVITFTEYWQDRAKEQGITKCIGFLPHGFCREIFYPIPKEVARRYLGMDPSACDDEFVVLNMNRNQPRKRWDLCVRAFVLALKHALANGGRRTIKLVVATQVTGAWHLLEILQRECSKEKVPFQRAIESFVVINQPQALTDFDVNVMYNVADIGINTCDGEGFGLCNFEQAAIGKPQVVPAIGGFLDFFDSETALMVEPVVNYYVDQTRDMLGGEAQLCRSEDFAAAIIKYYDNPDLVKTHGENARRKLAKNPKYDWDNICDTFCKLAKVGVGIKAEEPDPTSEEIDDISRQVDDLVNGSGPAAAASTVAAKKKKTGVRIKKRR